MKETKKPSDESAIQAIQDVITVSPAGTFFLAGIFLILFFVVIKVAADLIIPVLMAFILKLVFLPLMNSLKKLKLPDTVAALFVITTFLFIIYLFGILAYGQASSLIDSLPQSLNKLEHKLGYVSDSIEEAQKVVSQAENITTLDNTKKVQIQLEGSALSDKIFNGTQKFTGSFLTTIVVLFFLLVSGDVFLRRVVEILPKFKDKRQAVDISQQIENDISKYLVTITVMNALVGIAAGCIMAFFGISNPILWGVIAFLLNYIPVIGPFIGIALFFVVSMVNTTSLVAAIIPAGLYLLIHIIEGTFITPLLLAKRFTINPVLILLSLLFWHWMWGLVGAILAVPLLAIIKIICDRIERLKPIGHLIGG